MFFHLPKALSESKSISLKEWATAVLAPVEGYQVREPPPRPDRLRRAALAHRKGGGNAGALARAARWGRRPPLLLLPSACCFWDGVERDAMRTAAIPPARQTRRCLLWALHWTPDAACAPAHVHPQQATPFLS